MCELVYISIVRLYGKCVFHTENNLNTVKPHTYMETFTPIRARVSKQGKRKTGKPIYVILIPMDYNDIFRHHDLVEIRRVES